MCFNCVIVTVESIVYSLVMKQPVYIRVSSQKAGSWSILCYPNPPSVQALIHSLYCNATFPSPTSEETLARYETVSLPAYGERVPVFYYGHFWSAFITLMVLFLRRGGVGLRAGAHLWNTVVTFKSTQSKQLLKLSWPWCDAKTSDLVVLMSNVVVFYPITNTTHSPALLRSQRVPPLTWVVKWLFGFRAVYKDRHLSFTCLHMHS